VRWVVGTLRACSNPNDARNSKFDNPHGAGEVDIKKICDVHLPTTDGLDLILSRYTQPESDSTPA
jgi:hypothetical protein